MTLKLSQQVTNSGWYWLGAEHNGNAKFKLPCRNKQIAAPPSVLQQSPKDLRNWIKLTRPFVSRSVLWPLWLLVLCCSSFATLELQAWQRKTTPFRVKAVPQLRAEMIKTELQSANATFHPHYRTRTEHLEHTGTCRLHEEVGFLSKAVATVCYQISEAPTLILLIHVYLSPILVSSCFVLISTLPAAEMHPSRSCSLRATGNRFSSVA